MTRTKTTVRLSLVIERVEVTFPSAPFPAARKTIVVEGETLSDIKLPSSPGVARCAPVIPLRRTGSR